MQRQILFRGKRADTGQWIEGYYSVYSDYRDNKYYQIRSSNGMHNDVIPETVGQFTGLTDKNGKKIFEGDIVKFVSGIIGIVAFKEGTFLATINDKDGRPFYISGRNIQYVIGNLTDNPELLNQQS